MNISVNVTLGDLADALRRLVDEARGAAAQGRQPRESREAKR